MKDEIRGEGIGQQKIEEKRSRNKPSERGERLGGNPKLWNYFYLSLYQRYK